MVYGIPEKGRRGVVYCVNSIAIVRAMQVGGGDKGLSIRTRKPRIEQYLVNKGCGDGAPARGAGRGRVRSLVVSGERRVDARLSRTRVGDHS